MLYTHLRAFHAVATQGGFSRAAAALHVTQPTISDQVKALETRYGVLLFERRRRRVVLTGLGRELLAVTRQQFSLEAEAEQLLLSAKGLAYGRLRVGADAPFLVVPLLGSFKRRHPGIQLSVTFGNTEQVLRRLFERDCDVAVLPEIGADDRLHSVPFRRDRLVAFVHRGHPWVRRRSIRLQELAEQPLVLREAESTTRIIFERVMAHAGVALGETLEIGSREGVREAVAAGLGIGIVSQTEFGTDTRLHTLELSQPGLEVVEYATCIKERRPVRVVSAFFDVLQDTSEKTA